MIFYEALLIGIAVALFYFLIVFFLLMFNLVKERKQEEKSKNAPNIRMGAKND
jgi:hypothetical protein